MAKNYNHTEEMLETMESIIKKVRPIADNCCKYEDAVNEITKKEARFSSISQTPRFLVQRYGIDLCRTILDSRMAKRDKESVLSLINGLVESAITGGYLAALSDNGVEWDNMIRHNADKRIADYKKRWMK